MRKRIELVSYYVCEFKLLVFNSQFILLLKEKANFYLNVLLQWIPLQHKSGRFDNINIYVCSVPKNFLVKLQIAMLKIILYLQSFYGPGKLNRRPADLL